MALAPSGHTSSDAFAGSQSNVSMGNVWWIASIGDEDVVAGDAAGCVVGAPPRDVRRLPGAACDRMKATFCSVIPLIPTGGGLADALAFYTEHMGFSIVWESGGMAGIRRDGIAFNLVQNDNRVWANNASFSIGVSDLEALYEEYRRIPARVGPLELKAWGRREFHMIVPSGVCLQFYENES
jgi:hypothetical protein